MKVGKRIILSLVLLSVGMPNIFSAIKLPMVEILGTKYYVYEMKKGDSLYGISKLYGWDTNELTRLNPQAVRGMEKGVKVYYPVEDKVSAFNNPVVPEEVANIRMEHLTHLVKRGETVYSISVLYDKPVEEIYRLNPSAREGIKEGELITLFEDGGSQGDADYIFYKVKDGDTLYGVAKEFHSTVKRLMEINPGVSDRNFKSGSIIRIPSSVESPDMKTINVDEERLASFSLYKVDKDDTWESIASKFNISKEELMQANEDVRKLKRNEMITIPKIETVEVEKEVVYKDTREESAEGRENIYQEINGLTPDSVFDRINAVYVMTEPGSRRDLEFSRGFIAGLDKMKNRDLKINFKIIDGSKETESVVDSLINSAPDVLFITSDKSIPDYLSTYALDQKVPMVNVFDLKSENYLSNPYIVQYFTPSNYFNEDAANALAKEFNGRTILFVGASDEETDLISEILKQNMADSPMIALSLEELEIYPFIDDMKYLVYAYPTKKNEVGKVLDLIISAREESPLADIAIVGRPNWVMYEDSYKEKYSQNDVHIPSRFYLDLDSEESKTFISDYKQIFEKGPMKSYPLYAGVGYDVACYFLPELLKNGGDISLSRPSDNLLLNNMDLERLSNWSGYFNAASYIVRYTPYGTIEKIKTK